jgi:hypothetical protein
MGRNLFKKTIHSPYFLLHPVASDPIGKSGYFQSLKIGKTFIKWPNTIKVLKTEVHLHISTGDIAADAQKLVDICVQKNKKFHIDEGRLIDERL